MSPNRYHTPHWSSTTMIHTANVFINLARKEKKRDPFPFLVPSILLSFAAVEAGVNALIHYALREDKNLHSLIKKYIKEKLKASPPASIKDKILYFTYFLTRKSFNIEGRLWERFRNLQNLRNKIIHYKLEELEQDEAELLAEALPFKTKDEKLATKAVRETFYKNLFAREVTIGKAVEAVETASEILKKLYSFYYRR